MENKEKDWCREKDWGCGDDGTSDRRSSSSSWKKCLEISQKLGSIGMGLGPISRWSSMKGKAEQKKRRTWAVKAGEEEQAEKKGWKGG